MERVCNNFTVQTIYHAAAYKHVPMVEKNIGEGIKNNIFGTYHCAQAAINTQVETFVLISTDKAVRPTNTMGATKRFAELILQGLSHSDQQHNTRFTMVRFGNVLGSSGSVIPLFKEQIRNSKIVTVTDPEIIRYFMTIPEAAQLVIQAGAMGKGGDVFVLDMGKPIKILDLAKRMIQLSGYEVKDKNHPEGDVEIIFTGLRPGEKLYEELLIGNNVSKTAHQRIMRAQEDILPWSSIEDFMIKMTATSEKESSMRNILQEAVNGFEPQCEVIDVLYSHSHIHKIR
jgi:FlaA1/EpsC-like NDP-sugar epimerase